MAPEVEDRRKFTADIVEAVDQPVRGFPKQKIAFGKIGRGTVAMGAHGLAIKRGWAVIHERYMAWRGRWRKRAAGTDAPLARLTGQGRFDRIAE
jgi:hypothetical protein